MLHAAAAWARPTPRFLRLRRQPAGRWQLSPSCGLGMPSQNGAPPSLPWRLSAMSTPASGHRGHSMIAEAVELNSLQAKKYQPAEDIARNALVCESANVAW